MKINFTNNEKDCCRYSFNDFFNLIREVKEADTFQKSEVELTENQVMFMSGYHSALENLELQLLHKFEKKVAAQRKIEESENEKRKEKEVLRAVGLSNYRVLVEFRNKEVRELHLNELINREGSMFYKYLYEEDVFRANVRVKDNRLCWALYDGDELWDYVWLDNCDIYRAGLKVKVDEEAYNQLEKSISVNE